MTLRRPDAGELAGIGTLTGIDLTAAEIATLEPIIATVLDGYDALDQWPDPIRTVTSAVRIPGARPGAVLPVENPEIWIRPEGTNS